MPGQLPRANCLKKHRRARRDASADIKRCNAPAQAGVCKERTFESTLVIPLRKKRKKTKPTPPRRQTRAVSAKRTPAIEPTSPQLTEEEKREMRRIRASENRQRRKELGLCKDCPNQAIKGQTRCPNCVEAHRRTQQPQRK